MHVSLIAALDCTFAIGKGNALPWHLPDDLKRFKALTLGKPILMGRKTAESLGRALPGRRNLVLTRGGQAPFDGMHVVASLEEAIETAVVDGDELCVIGGGEVYALAMPSATRMHLTHLHTTVEHADAFFPAFDAREWRTTGHASHAVDSRHAFAFDFTDYARR